MEYAARISALLTGLRREFGGLRPMEEGDLPEYLALCRSNDFFNSISLDEPPTLESCREDLAALPPGRRPEHKLFLGLWGEERLQAALDLAEGYPEEGTLYIGLLELDAACQGRGLGTALVTALARRSVLAGFSTLRLGCLVENAPGFGFWQAMGFQEEARSHLGKRPVRKMVRNLN